MASHGSRYVVMSGGVPYFVADSLAVAEEFSDVLGGTVERVPVAGDFGVGLLPPVLDDDAPLEERIWKQKLVETLDYIKERLGGQ